MKLCVALPLADIGGEPETVREFAEAAEEIGYDGLAVADHVLGVNAASRPGWGIRATSATLYHDPFVLFGFLAPFSLVGGSSTQLLALRQHQHLGRGLADQAERREKPEQYERVVVERRRSGADAPAGAAGGVDA